MSFLLLFRVLRRQDDSLLDLDVLKEVLTVLHSEVVPHRRKDL